MMDYKSNHLTPAEYVIKVFRGIRATARAVGRSPNAVSKWQNPHTKRGAAGIIPANMHLKILQVAQEKSLDITANDLVYGRKVKYGKEG